MSQLREINMRDVRGYSEMIRYLSELTGLSSLIQVPISKWDDTPNVKHATIDRINYKLGKKHLKGNIPVYTLSLNNTEIKTLSINYKFDSLFYYKHRTLDEFNVDYKVLRSACKWDEGNGAYSIQDVYIINNKNFINI